MIENNKSVVVSIPIRDGAESFQEYRVTQPTWSWSATACFRSSLHRRTSARPPVRVVTPRPASGRRSTAAPQLVRQFAAIWEGVRE
nr:hypothetical protein Itr_chr06CG09600 [Ipomoea trifida]